MILTELFFLVVYLSLVGGLFGVVSLLLSRVLKRALSLWFSLCGLALYGIPVLSPQVRLFSPQPEQRLPAFHMAALVWAVGCVLFLAYRVTQLLLAGKSLRRRPPCQNQRLLGLAAQCAQSLGRKRTPPLLETPLDAPISVAGALRPVLLVDAATLSQLTDAQLQAVLTHELTHIRRHHLLLQRVYDVACAVHWFNPLAWLCREDFALHCEADCDAHALRSLTGSVTSGEYARAILRSLELSSTPSAGWAAFWQSPPRGGSACWRQGWRVCWCWPWPFPRSSAASTSIPTPPIPWAQSPGPSRPALFYLINLQM